jgi:hypothetical protein
MHVPQTDLCLDSGASGPLCLTRRRLVLAGLGVLLSRRARAAFVLPGTGQINCAVLREGQHIGQAAYQFDRNGDSLTVAIAIDVQVKLGFITVFRYRHRNTECWQADQLMRFEAHTNDNGNPGFAAAHWNGTALEVVGSRTAPYTAPPRALATTYWNPRTLVDPLINTQHGNLLKVRMIDRGPSRAVLQDGQTVEATEYNMVGDMRMNLWYDHGQHFAGLQYYAHDGSIVTYEKA